MSKLPYRPCSTYRLYVSYEHAGSQGRLASRCFFSEIELDVRPAGPELFQDEKNGTGRKVASRCMVLRLGSVRSIFGRSLILAEGRLDLLT